MFTRPDQGANLPGTWRGTPETLGGMGIMAGARGGAYVSSPTTGNTPGAWSPTVGNLVVLIGLEIIAYALLRYAFRTAHGG